MKLSIIPISLVMMILVVTSIALAESPSSNTVVSFDQPENFLDFRSRTVLTKIDRDRLMAELDKQIQRTVKRILPDGQAMHINFTNIDMAGYIYPNANETRTVRQDADKSLLVFDYTIFDADGKSIKTGKERLINQHFKLMSHESKRYERSSFKYEMVMFSRWLKKITKTL